MEYLVYGMIVVAVGFVVGRLSGRGSGQPATKAKLKEMRTEAREALTERTEERKEKILEMMEREVEHQAELAKCQVVDKEKGITRQDIEELLDVTRGTALKYLNELEKEGKIRQIGTTSKDVYYVLK